MIGDACDHSAVVAAEFERRKYARDIVPFGEQRAQVRIGGDSSACDDGCKTRVFHRAEKARRERAARNVLKRCAHIFRRRLKAFVQKEITP